MPEYYTNRLGKVKKKLLGVGTNYHKLPTRTSKGIVGSYKAWYNMLVRCYCKIYQKRQPSYIGCYVSDNWKEYSNFKVFYDNNYRAGYQLDKDLISPGNKEYGVATCSYIPQQVNLVLGGDAIKGTYKKGVTWSKQNKAYIAQVTVENIHKTLGQFDAEEDAYACYKEAKESHVKEIAERYFKAGQIPEKVYNSLMKWVVK